MTDQNDDADNTADDGSDGDETRYGDDPAPRRPLDPALTDAVANAIRRHLPEVTNIIAPAALAAVEKMQNSLREVSKAFEPHLINLAKLQLSYPSGLEKALARLRDKLPPNWPRDLDPDLLERAFPIVQDEGIPLVWVPRADIMTALLTVDTRGERIEILLARFGDVVQDCRDVLATVDHPDLANQIPLAAKAIDAYDQGHVEAAQALAVVIVETAVSRTFDKRYATVKKLVKINDPSELTVAELRLRTALAAIGPFYVPWHPDTGVPAPTELSRHVAVHQADAGHYTHGNSIIAVMLLTSILRAIQESLQSP